MQTYTFKALLPKGQTEDAINLCLLLNRINESVTSKITFGNATLVVRDTLYGQPSVEFKDELTEFFWETSTLFLSITNEQDQIIYVLPQEG